MTKIFVSSRILKSEEKESELEESVRKKLIESGIDPSKIGRVGTTYDGGVLGSIADEVHKIFEDSGYPEAKDKNRRTDEHFICMQNRVYSLKILDSEEISGSLILGARPCNGEMVGMVKIEVYHPEYYKEVIDKVRTCFSQYSMPFIERDADG